MRRFIRNKRGIAWVWAMAFLAFVVFSMLFMVCTIVFNVLMETLESSYVYNDQQMTTITTLRWVVNIGFPGFMAFGILLWAYVNSGRREDVTYPP